MIGAIPEAGYADVSYVDDVVIMAHARTNASMLNLIQCALAAYHEETSKRGLKMNYASNKTEVLLQPAGTGVRAFKTRIYSPSYQPKFQWYRSMAFFM